MVQWDCKGAQNPGSSQMFERDTTRAIQPNFPKHRTRKAGEIVPKFCKNEAEWCGIWQRMTELSEVIDVMYFDWWVEKAVVMGLLWQIFVNGDQVSEPRMVTWVYNWVWYPTWGSTLTVGLTKTWHNFLWVQGCQVPDSLLIWYHSGHRANGDFERIHGIRRSNSVSWVAMNINDMSQNIFVRQRQSHRVWVAVVCRCLRTILDAITSQQAFYPTPSFNDHVA